MSDNTDKRITAMLTNGMQIQIRPLTPQDTALEKDVIRRLLPSRDAFDLSPL